MVSLIYDKTLTLREGGVDDSAAVSLMSNDVDEIAFALEELNEVWSRTIEIAIGIPLLTLQLGWVSVVPLVVVACKFSTTRSNSLRRGLQSYDKFVSMLHTNKYVKYPLVAHR